jgi:hypothetical protein
MLLIGLILVCPFLCGTAEADHVTHREHPMSGPVDNTAPCHCPAESDDCICRGAVQSADIRLPDIDSVCSPIPAHGLPGILEHAPAHSFAHLTTDGNPTGLAGWGDAITIRALLQDFRC